MEGLCHLRPDLYPYEDFEQLPSGRRVSANSDISDAVVVQLSEEPMMALL